MYDTPLAANITDPIGTLVVKVAETIQKLADGQMTGQQLALHMEAMEKCIAPALDHGDWLYVDGPPEEAIGVIKRTATALRRIGLAIGTGHVRSSSYVLPSHRQWGRGKGLKRTLERVERRWTVDWRSTKPELENEFASLAFALVNDETEAFIWPERDICLLVPCTTVVELFEWLAVNMDALQLLRTRCVTLSVVPTLKDKVVPQLAFVITGMAPLPDTEFEARWRDELNGVNWHFSETLRSFQLAKELMVSVYAVQELLDGRDLLDEELTLLATWRDEAQALIGAIQDVADADSGGPAALAEAYLIDLHRQLTTDHHEGTEVSAVGFARASMSAAFGGEADSSVLQAAGVVIQLVEEELGIVDRHSES